ncbi:MAG: hypothetical protein ACTHOB_13260 [Ginsengibacter sp.]
MFKKFILISCFFTILNISCKSQPIDSNWKGLFEKSYYEGYRGFPPLKDYWITLSNSKRVTAFEPLSYGLDAILAMYEATGSVKYIADAIMLTNNIIKKAKTTNKIPGNRFRLKDEYKGWIEDGADSTSGIFHSETVLSEIYFFQYVGRLLKDIHNNEKLYQKPYFKEFYNKTLDFIENNIWRKWESRGIRFENNKYDYLLLNRTHMASHWAYIATELYFLTKSDSLRNDYITFIKTYNKKLENNFFKYDKYILWNQTWDDITDSKKIVQDVSHANLIVSYIVEAFSLGLWKDSDAIQRIINTLKDKLWDSQDCLFADNLDGTMFETGYQGSVGSFQADGFVKLTRYDPSLLSIYEKFVNCSKYLTTWYQYGQLFANLTLSVRLLKSHH